MPTYYTADINEKGQTFRDFVKKCLEAFVKEQIPYDGSGLINARSKYKEFKNDPKEYYSMEQWSVKSKVSSLDTKIRWSKKAYDRMLESAQRFEVPLELAPLKEFMITQLTTSIEADCDRTYLGVLENSVADYDVWFAHTEKTLLGDIEFHQRDCERQIREIMHHNEMTYKLEQALVYYECN